MRSHRYILFLVFAVLFFIVCLTYSLSNVGDTPSLDPNFACRDHNGVARVEQYNDVVINAVCRDGFFVKNT